MAGEVLINTRALEDRLGGNFELFRELAELFMANREDLVAPLKKAIDEMNGAAIGKAAHTIKGAVANFSGERAFRAAYDLEMIGKQGDLGRVHEARDLLLREIELMSEALGGLLRKGSF